eukprot:185932-Pleurochrysis_carterae.AAC.1
MTPRLKELMLHASRAAESDGLDTTAFKLQGDIIKVLCSATSEAALAGGDRARMEYTVDVKAASR